MGPVYSELWDNRENNNTTTTHQSPKAVSRGGNWSMEGTLKGYLVPISSISKMEKTGWVSKAWSTSPKSPIVNWGRFLNLLGF